MRDAYGGVVNLVIIVVFMVIVSGYLAYNVNYAKAFKVKNKIISYFEQYGTQCEKPGSDCNEKIKAYMQEIGYSTDTTFTKLQGKPTNGVEGAGGDVGTWECKQEVGYCWAKFNALSSGGAVEDIVGAGKTKVYYKVATRINMDIPIINRFMPTIFEVTGATKQIVVSK